jgi:FkbM family methyltransferase
MTARDLAMRTGRAVLRLLPRGTVMPVVRGPLRGLRWVVGTAPHGAWLGRLETDALADFAAHIDGNAVVWDVGANVGLYTLAAARRARQVVAFEPAAENVAALTRHLSINRLKNVEIVAAAVSNVEGTARLAAGASPSEFRLADEGEPVPCVTLDAWRQSSGAPAPDVIKIDVEGAESAVLDGAAETIRAALPRIYLAVHDRQHAPCEVRLRGWGYELHVAGGAAWTADAPEWIAVRPRG